MARPAADPPAELLAPARVRIIDGVQARSREAEFAWLREHAHEHAGEWVALDGQRLLAASVDLDDVYARLSPAEIERALLHRVVTD
jgi:hypothetical protein